MSIAPSLWAIPIANSVSDFSGTQGFLNWYYGYYTSPFTPATFTEYNHYDPTPDFTATSGEWVQDSATFYSNSAYWATLFDQGGHPESTTTTAPRTAVNEWSVRRWVSTIDGDITITGHIAKQNPSGGDGTTEYILDNGATVLTQFIAGTDGAGVDYTVTIDNVHIGDDIDFAISPNSNDFFDGTFFTAQIDVTPVPEPDTLLLLSAGLFALQRKRRS